MYVAIITIGITISLGVYWLGFKQFDKYTKLFGIQKGRFKKPKVHIFSFQSLVFYLSSAILFLFIQTIPNETLNILGTVMAIVLVILSLAMIGVAIWKIYLSKIK